MRLEASDKCGRMGKVGKNDFPDCCLSVPSRSSHNNAKQGPRHQETSRDMSQFLKRHHVEPVGTILKALGISSNLEGFTSSDPGDGMWLFKVFAT